MLTVASTSSSRSNNEARAGRERHGESRQDNAAGAQSGSGRLKGTGTGKETRLEGAGNGRVRFGSEKQQRGGRIRSHLTNDPKTHEMTWKWSPGLILYLDTVSFPEVIRRTNHSTTTKKRQLAFFLRDCLAKSIK